MTPPPQTRRVLMTYSALSHFSRNHAAGREGQRIPPVAATPAPSLCSSAATERMRLRFASFGRLRRRYHAEGSQWRKGLAEGIQATRTTRHSDTTSVPWYAVAVSGSDGKDLPTDRCKERLATGERPGCFRATGRRWTPSGCRTSNRRCWWCGVELTGSPMPQYAPAPMAMPMAVPMPVPAPAAPTKDTRPPGPPVPVPARVQ